MEKSKPVLKTVEINQIQWVGGILVGGSVTYWFYRNNLKSEFFGDWESKGHLGKSVMVGWVAGAITGVFIVPIVLVPLYMTGIMTM